MKEIRVTAHGADILPIDALIEFQGNLKTITRANLDKLKRSILKHGFTAPIFVWKGVDNHILDGHQRLKALIEMRQEGYSIPLLPVVYIDADSEAHAKEKLLYITSQYGDFTTEGFAEFVSELDFDFDDIRLTDGEFSFDDEDKKGERGGHYNDEKAPEIDAYKLAYRIESIMSLSKRNLCVDVYAGRKILSKWYSRSFEKVITNDQQKFEDVKHDYNMKAIDFIDEVVKDHIDFDYIDFDDEGCPAKEIQKFFNLIEGKKKNEFVMAVTDGQGLNLKSHGNINYQKTYMIRDDKIVRATSDDYYNFTNIFKSFIDAVTNKHGFSYKELGFHRKNNGNAIYATYLVKEKDGL